jgi:hypothetical protein
MAPIHWEETNCSVHLWVLHADQRYLAARFLHWEGFYHDWAILASFSLELYLKAYLIYQKGQNPVTFNPQHDLRTLLEECAKFDGFFKSILNSPNFNATWPSYLSFLRYPEPLSNQQRSLPLIGIENLGNFDSVVSHVRKVVPFPDNHSDAIGDILKGKMPIGMVPYADISVIKEHLLRDNRFFSG